MGSNESSRSQLIFNGSTNFINFAQSRHHQTSPALYNFVSQITNRPTQANMKCSILTVLLSFLALHSVTVCAEGNDFDILDQLLGDYETSTDYAILYNLDIDISECDDEAESHSQFVQCAKQALTQYESDMTKEDVEQITAAIPSSDFGKSAAELLLEETNIALSGKDLESLDACEQTASSLEGYKECINRTLKKLIIMGTLKRKDTKTLMKAVEESVEIA